MVDRDTLHIFIKYNMEKFNKEGQCTMHVGDNGRPRKPGRVVARIKNLMLNKTRRSLRTVAAKVGQVSYRTVKNIMDRAGMKPYHKRKVQKMTSIHKENRVKFARWALRHYGNSLGAGSV